MKLSMGRILSSLFRAYGMTIFRYKILTEMAFLIFALKLISPLWRDRLGKTTEDCMHTH